MNKYQKVDPTKNFPTTTPKVLSKQVSTRAKRSSLKQLEVFVNETDFSPNSVLATAAKGFLLSKKGCVCGFAFLG